uniref:Uncharacterized protein n=1 Tax=Physcomitrium patens TaxID=3218 RepID=A0A7I3ZK59_PHYPA
MAAALKEMSWAVSRVSSTVALSVAGALHTMIFKCAPRLLFSSSSLPPCPPSF